MIIQPAKLYADLVVDSGAYPLTTTGQLVCRKWQVLMT
jgi:hypothetical protein